MESNTKSSTDQPLNDSQTASEFIDSQLKLEADAREVLPFSFDHCTQPLGPLRQNIFSCITCNPPPESPSDPYTPAGICYACSIACHGEHELVELFAHRNFVCDCGTSRLPESSPCTRRVDPNTGIKGPVHSQKPAEGNTYNQNFRNRFCGCSELYDAHKQKGTMYQCLGLATEQDGGCGEDWWHPECLLGLPKDWHQDDKEAKETNESGPKPTAREGSTEEQEEEDPVPPGFPAEADFDSLICYKCVEAAPWIRRYAGSSGFIVLENGKTEPAESDSIKLGTASNESVDSASATEPKVAASTDSLQVPTSKKRKADDDDIETESISSKRTKVEEEIEAESSAKPIHLTLPESRVGVFSLLPKNDDFRELFCRCAECYPALAKHPQLLEVEEVYEPPVSEDGDGPGAGSVGTGSLLDRGEAALSNVDRVRAIEGVMVYNHLKDKVKSFLQPYAESGQVVGAEDIKAYFETLRGDAAAIRAAGGAALANGGGEPEGDNRQEQNGY